MIILSVKKDMTQATFEGNAILNNKTGYVFEVSVANSGSNETFSITIFDSSGNVVYQKSGAVMGEIQIHN